MNYNELKVSELKNLANQRKIRGFSKMKKDELINALIAYDEHPTKADQKKEPKLLKYKCDICGEWKPNCKGINDQLVCQDCASKIEESKEETNEVEQELVPMPGIEKLEELKKETTKAKLLDSSKVPSKKAITFNGKTQSLMEWSKELGIGYKTLNGRIYYRGVSVEEAFTTPIRRK